MNKKIRNFILISMAIIILAMPFLAFGEDIAKGLFGVTAEEKVELLQEGSFNEEIVESAEFVEENLDKMSDENSTRAAMTIEDYIYRQLKYVEGQIALANYGFTVTMDEFKKVYTNVINDHPDLFYVSSSYSYTTYDDKTVYYAYPNYVMDSSAVSKAKQTFEKGVQRALSQVNDSMTDVQKVLTLHDYFCNIATYPADAETNDKQIYHSAYGIFYDGNTVCAGYTLAFTYVLDRLGIESEYVVSTEMAHAWNKVKINGSWFNIDLTYDDNSLNDGRKNPYGSVFHRCFLKSDDFMATADGYYHYGGATYDDCSATNKDYDTSTWNDVSTNIYFYKGGYYSIDYEPNSSKLYFYCTDNTGTHKVDSNEISYDSKSFTTQHKPTGYLFSRYVTTKDAYSRLVLLDGKFYVSSWGIVYVYIQDSTGKWNKQEFINAGESIVGLGVDFNGNLIYQKKTDFAINTLNKMNYFKYNVTQNNSDYHFYADTNNDGIINAKDYAKMKNDCK